MYCMYSQEFEGKVELNFLWVDSDSEILLRLETLVWVEHGRRLQRCATECGTPSRVVGSFIIHLGRRDIGLLEACLY
jgi:hypothetical protein